MLYLRRDSHLVVEKISSGKTLIERDGYHKVPGNCIYRDASGREDAISIVFQGRVLPYGDEQTKQSLEQMNYEIIATHYLGGKLDVDSSLGRFLSWLGKNGVTVFLIFLGIGVLYGMVSGGV